VGEVGGSTGRGAKRSGVGSGGRGGGGGRDRVPTKTNTLFSGWSASPTLFKPKEKI